MSLMLLYHHDLCYVQLVTINLELELELELAPSLQLRTRLELGRIHAPAHELRALLFVFRGSRNLTPSLG